MRGLLPATLADPALMSVILLPNFGAEEGTPWRQAIREPRLRRMARVWRSLFHALARFPAECEEPGLPPRAAGREHAVFRDLERYGTLHPWLVTEEAERFAAEMGLKLAGPSAALVRELHDKAFAVDQSRRLGLEPDSVLGLFVVLEASDLRPPAGGVDRIRAILSQWPIELARRFALKPRFGGSGRGRVTGSIDDLLRPEIISGLARLADQGGAILEPWLDRLEDVSVQFLVRGPGRVLHLGSLSQILSVSGSFFGHRGVLTRDGAIRAGTGWDSVATGAGSWIAESAGNRGFTGPCGIDGFSFRSPRERAEIELRPVCEFNARFTMGTVTVGVIERLRQEGRFDRLLTANGSAAFLLRLGPPGEIWPQDGRFGEVELIRLDPIEPELGAAVIIGPSARTLDEVMLSFVARAERVTPALA
jgi:hypothetical protein